MQIDGKLIEYLEDLSCLTLSEGEKIRLAKDLGDILTGMNKLGELDTGAVVERSHPFDNVNAFREDEVFPSFNRELILKNAYAEDGVAILAPKTVE